MSSSIKCKNCGSTDIEEDLSTVCTNCGTVLDEHVIVSEVQFEESGHGASAIGQFISADTSGGATIYGKFQVGSGNESREVTIKRAKTGITHLCTQLQLSQHYIDISLNFFKMALSRNITRGRKTTHVYAACVYMTCRTEGTSHLLIDISDVLQICSYELGRTYLKLSTVLCINPPSIDPCLYILRFANKLQFGSKTHEVSNTALRIVQRMKKDSIHSGRRPTGLCGAALLMASRMHDFSRSIGDIVKIVKIHESTVRKRLTEFADTPSSALTLDEFMSVDLEAEQDPPAFKAARKRDRERIQKIPETEITELQKEINAQIEKHLKKPTRREYNLINYDNNEIIDDPTYKDEIKQIDECQNEVTLQAITECISDVTQNQSEDLANESEHKRAIEGLRPDILSLCTPPSQLNKTDRTYEQEQLNDNAVLSCLSDVDDDEINNIILTDGEIEAKRIFWKELHTDYLQAVKLKEEKLAKEKEEGKPEKKKRKPRKKTIGPSNTAGEAIEKMLQEKKLSNKINYDILRSLTEPKIENNESKSIIKKDEIGENIATAEATTTTSMKAEEDSKYVVKEEILLTPPTTTKYSDKKRRDVGLPIVNSVLTKLEPEVIIDEINYAEEDEAEPEVENEPEPEYSSLKDLLNNGDREDDDYYGYDDDAY